MFRSVAKTAAGVVLVLLAVAAAILGILVFWRRRRPTGAGGRPKPR